MTEKRIREVSANVSYISMDNESWFRVVAYAEDCFLTIYEGVDTEEDCELTYEELADRDDVTFYTLTKIEEG